MVKECYLSGLQIDDCCASATLVITDFGQCFKIEKINKLDTKVISGAQFGLEIVMDVQVNEASSECLARVHMHLCVAQM
jgi:hypothetical protein